MFITTLRAKKPNVHQWIDKQNAVYVCDGILCSHKKNEVRIHSTMWINVDDIILSERIKT